MEFNDNENLILNLRQLRAVMLENLDLPPYYVLARNDPHTKILSDYLGLQDGDCTIYWDSGDLTETARKMEMFCGPHGKTLLRMLRIKHGGDDVQSAE